jgi:integrase
MLSDRQIKLAKPTDKHQFIADGHGLYLRIHPSGKKQFVYRTRVGGTAKWIPLGDYPQIALSSAREKVRAGITNDTVNDVYKLFRKSFLSKYKRPEISESRFNLDVLPMIGGMRIMDVTKRHISEVLQRAIDRNAPVAANRTLADIQHLFQFAFERGYVGENPCQGVTRRAAGGKEKPRDVALSFSEIEDFLSILHQQVVGKRGMNVTTAAALYLALLTALRGNEVLQLMRGYVGGSQFEVDTKTGKKHTVYLSIQARAVLKLTNGLPLPADVRVLSHATRRLQCKFTPHDLRRTLATRLSDLGVMPHVIEKLLGHEMQGVMAVYNRSDYMLDRISAMNLWGREIAKMRRKNTRR